MIFFSPSLLEAVEGIFVFKMPSPTSSPIEIPSSPAKVRSSCSAKGDFPRSFAETVP